MSAVGPPPAGRANAGLLLGVGTEALSGWQATLINSTLRSAQRRSDGVRRGRIGRIGSGIPGLVKRVRSGLSYGDTDRRAFFARR